MIHLRRLTILLAVIAILLPASAWAQYGSSALVSPGDKLPPQLLADQGGNVGRELARLVGRRPIFVSYWRPGDALSEQALVTARDLVRNSAREVAFFPIAVMAASQPATAIRERLVAMGLDDVAPRSDSGSLARIVGVRQVPSFLLVDVGGVLRLVGGADIEQNAESGMSIATAVIKAGKAEGVPTLGVLPSEPVYRMLGRRLPELMGTEVGSETPRPLASFGGQGKKTLLFYWSPSCAHCKRALPELEQWYLENKPTDLTIIDVARSDSIYLTRAIPEIISKYPWVHVLDKDRSIGRGLTVRSTPTTFLMGPDGKILSIKVGGNVDWAQWLGTR